MPYVPNTLHDAFKTTYAAQLAALITAHPAGGIASVDLQEAMATALEAAFVAAIATLGIISPVGLVAPPTGGPVTGATAPGSIG